MSCEGLLKISVKWTAISWGVVNECSIGVGVIAMDWRDVRISGNSGKCVKEV